MSLELGIGDTTNPIKPFATISSVVEIFEYIRSHAADSSSPGIRLLEIQSGCKNQLGTVSSVGWEREESQLFRVMPAEKEEDVQAGKCVAFSNGVEYSGKGLEQIQNIEEEIGEEGEATEEDMKIWRALNGPRPTEW